ncbi:MAG: insulinase family protein [Dysgonamonadaceae bacterium]|jgi:predicted Zn-dependent peptidase|nr:insulinase family protein [Dysgonamonadaceae bacterium]
MNYDTFSLNNGLRVIYLPSKSPVAYCGLAVNAGTRDEDTHQHGLAHFIEHTLFKGTQKRKAWHILNRMEHVGGELNAYTTKEDTFIYSICLSEDTERAMELLADLVFHSQFPEQEIVKEREVVIDEIHSYQDNPSELIFDEFENLLFRGNEMGHSILGDEESLQTFTSEHCFDFTRRFYLPENMVFFYYGQMPLAKINHLAQRYLEIPLERSLPQRQRQAPERLRPIKELQQKELHQSHVMIGGPGYDAFHKNRTGLFLLNNILGGPGMNSRLNLVLRERNALVYNVESGLTTYTDTGVFSIYFGCDHESRERCLKLTYKELKKLREQQLTTSQLHAAVKQLKGQLGVASDHSENLALRMGKAFLHFNRYEMLPETYKKLEALTSRQLLEIANEVWDESGLFELIYE